MTLMPRQSSSDVAPTTEPLPVLNATVVRTTQATARARRVIVWHVPHAPRYAGRLLLRAPVGAWRCLWASVLWVSDDEGRRVRAALSEHDSPASAEGQAYVRVSQQHRETQKMRFLLALVGLVVSLLLFAYIASTASGLLLAALTVLGVVVLGFLGSDDDAPVMDRRRTTDDDAPALTLDVVADALGSLGLSGIDRAMRDDPRALSFPSPVVRDGAGWRVEVDLPAGVTASDVVERRARLASALRRSESAVWPSPAPDAHAGRLLIYVSDKPLSKARPAVWPLVERGTASYFDPVPVGVDERGRPVSMTLAGASCVAGGVPRSGKTVGVRVLALAMALDPWCELHLVDGKAGADWLPFEPIATFLSAEDDDAALSAVVDDLRRVQADMRRRYTTLRKLPREDCPQGKVTADLAHRRDLGLHPVLYVLDESQIVLNGPAGKEAASIVEDLIRRGPAAGITLILATQRPSKDSIPTGASANASLRIAFRTMDHTSSDIIMGSGVGTAGYRSNTFTRSDVGLSWVLADGDDPSLCRWAYIDADDATAVIARARAARERLGLMPSLDDAPPARSILDDISSVWPENRARASFAELAEALTEAGHDATPDVVSAALRSAGCSSVQVNRRVDGRSSNLRGVTRTDLDTALASR